MSKIGETKEPEVLGEKTEVSEISQINNIGRTHSLALLPVQEQTFTNSGVVHQPKQPTTLQDLMRYSIEARGPGGRGENAVSGPIDREKSEFLMAALESMMVNPSEEVLKALEVVSEINPVVSEEHVPKYENALNIIVEYVSDIDVAIDFVKHGGMGAMHKVLNVQRENLQILAATIVGDCVQNNRYAQMCVMKEQSLLPQLMELVISAKSEDLKLKALYAVSCTLKNCPESIYTFSTYRGYELLKKVLEMDVEKLVIKAAYLIRALSSQDDKSIQVTFVRENYVHHLVSQIEQVHVQSSKELVLESLVIALQSLVDNNEMATEIVKSSNELKCSLQEIIKSVTGNDQYLELMTASVELLRIYGGSELQ